MTDKQPAIAKPSATTILVREGVAKPEILMVQRHADASFGSLYAFPGGVVSGTDRDVHTAFANWDDVTASAHLGMESGGLDYYSAAIRELFEETGVLLSREEVPGEQLVELRRKYTQGDLGWAELWTHAKLSPDSGALHYSSNWETPTVIPKRYDARFFIAVLPEGQEAVHDGEELTDSRWMTAEEALHAIKEKAMRVAFVTGRHLDYLRDIPDIPGLVKWAQKQQSAGIRKIRPFIIKEDGKQRFLLPGDPGYPDE